MSKSRDQKDSESVIDWVEHDLMYTRQKHVLSFLFGKDIPHVPSEDERPYYPEAEANIFSKIFMTWLFPILKVGFKRVLFKNDLFKLTPELQSKNMHDKYQKYLTKYSEKFKHKYSPRTICILALYMANFSQYTLAIMLSVISAAASALNPLLSKYLIRFVELKTDGNEQSNGKGVGYAIGTALLILVSGICQNHSFKESETVGAKARAILTSDIASKSLKLSENSKKRYPMGSMVSILGGDVSRVDLSLRYVPNLISFFISVIIALVILLTNIGVSALVAYGLLGLFLVMSVSLSRFVVRYRIEATRLTDSRITTTQEVLNNFKMVKYYSWENAYYKKISEFREKEMKNLMRVSLSRNFIMGTAFSFSTVVSMVSFLVLYAIKGIGNISSIFSSLSLFNILAQQVYIFPVVLSSAVDAYIAMGRISQFIFCEETEKRGIEHFEELSKRLDQDMAIKITNGSFSWPGISSNESNEKLSASSRTVLSDINICIKKESLTMVVGSIGVGKSSLLYAIMDKMDTISGRVELSSKPLLCSEPWIRNDTVKENIVFCSEFVKSKYDTIVDACCLLQDFELLAGGDQTEIGERGVTLSGGQKARISLARSVYKDRDIILLDNILSAVDANVANHIMQKCILGVLRNKTRVLVTHQLQFLKDADQIIFINGKGQLYSGTLEELNNSNADFREFVAYESKVAHQQSQKSEESEEGKGEKTEPSKEDNKRKRKNIMLNEVRSINHIPWEALKHYLYLGSKAFGVPVFWSTYLLSTMFATFCSIFCNVWLSFWVDKKFKEYSNGFYIGFYVMFSILSVLFLVFELLHIVKLTNDSAHLLHIEAIKNIFAVPLSFIERTPLGRIMNRFSRDTEVLDNELSNQARLSSYLASTVIGTIVLCIVYLPWFAIAIPILALIFIAVAGFYQASSREIKRLEAHERSFVYSNYGEILQGRDTIIDYDLEERFITRLENSIDNMNEAYYLSITNQRWLSVNLAVIACFFALIIAFLCVFSVFNIGASSAGLLLSYVLSIANQCIQLVRAVTQLENRLNSVERLYEYSANLEKEEKDLYNSPILSPSWPESGSMKFKDVCLRYRDDLPFVLKNLSFNVLPKERIGICGRTGAGKSSILYALFRFTELSSGSITIDNVDISKIKLKDLRAHMSVIPQDPELFKGTIRSNLDPFNESKDQEILDALRKVNLISDMNVESSKFSLDKSVDDDGSNFSLGEKQLIAFARALVRKTKILILDEATSQVDYQTDSQIQYAIRNAFADCTILCIAHRINTIIDYDKILVMDGGEVAEFDKPITLFNSNGIFRKMCDKAHIQRSDFPI